MFKSVSEEAERDIDAIRAMSAADGPNKKDADFDESLIHQRNFQEHEEQIAQQIQDLNDLE